LRGTNRALSICPDLPLAHWFAAPVFVARGAFDLGRDHLRAACAAVDAQRTDTKRFAVVGLRWLMGLILLAQGDEESALKEWEKELALDAPGHVYDRERCANTYYAIGALRLRQGRLAEARAAFEQALSRVPSHALAAIGLAAASGRVPDLHALESHAASDAVHVAMVRAVVLVLQGEHAAAARLCAEALAAAEPGSSGWLLPVEPLLNIAAHPEAWAAPLATLRARAL
jgi:tetratricopeptide (TPR) repeat protein